MTSPVPILMYHSIAAEATPAFRRWTVPPDRFAAHMIHLASAGYTSLTATEYGRLARAATLPERPVVITFDDGYADFRSAALPVLRDLGLKATLFVTAGYVGGTSEWLVREGETDRPMLTWEDLAASAGDDLEYGAHGYSHRQMDLLPGAEATADLARGIELLHARLGRPVTSLAYPHGYSTAKLRRRVAELGCEIAFGVVDALTSADDDRYAAARLIVDGDVGVDAFARLVAGDGVAVAPTGGGVTRAAWRAVRRSRIWLGVDRPHVPA